MSEPPTGPPAPYFVHSLILVMALSFSIVRCSLDAVEVAQGMGPKSQLCGARRTN